MSMRQREEVQAVLPRKNVRFHGFLDDCVFLTQTRTTRRSSLRFNPTETESVSDVRGLPELGASSVTMIP